MFLCILVVMLWTAALVMLVYTDFGSSMMIEMLTKVSTVVSDSRGTAPNTRSMYHIAY